MHVVLTNAHTHCMQDWWGDTAIYDKATTAASPGTTVLVLVAQYHAASYRRGALRPRPLAGRRRSSSPCTADPFVLVVAAITAVAATFARAATLDGSCDEDDLASAICAGLPAEESARRTGRGSLNWTCNQTPAMCINRWFDAHRLALKRTASRAVHL